MSNPKKRRCVLLCLLLTLCAVSARAQTLTGEIVIDGIPFTLDAKLLEPDVVWAQRYQARRRDWGAEPREAFDIGAVLSSPQDAANVPCGFDGERMYVTGRTFNRYCDQVLRFDRTSVEFHTLAGFNLDTVEFLSYCDLPNRVANPNQKQIFHGVWRARNPDPAQVPSLNGITYAQALQMIDGFKAPFESDVTIGEAYYVEAWDSTSRLARAKAMGGALLQSETDEVLAQRDYYVIRLRAYPKALTGLEGFAGLTGEVRSSLTGDPFSVCRSDVLAVVSAGGIERFTVSPYLENPEPLGEPQRLLTPQEALDAVRNAKDFFVSDDSFLPHEQTLSFDGQILEIAPELLIQRRTPDEDTYTILPVWAFHIRTRNVSRPLDTQSDYWDGAQEAVWQWEERTCFAVDAITGERVL